MLNIYIYIYICLRYLHSKQLQNIQNLWDQGTINIIFVFEIKFSIRHIQSSELNTC